MWHNALWTKDGRTLCGRWIYNQSTDGFTVVLEDETGQWFTFDDVDSLDFEGWRRFVESPFCEGMKTDEPINLLAPCMSRRYRGMLH